MVRVSESRILNVSADIKIPSSVVLIDGRLPPVDEVQSIEFLADSLELYHPRLVYYPHVPGTVQSSPQETKQ